MSKVDENWDPEEGAAENDGGAPEDWQNNSTLENREEELDRCGKEHLTHGCISPKNGGECMPYQ